METPPLPLSLPSPGVREALRVLRSDLAKRFGNRLEALRLFGSHARGDAGEDSDVDVLVVVRGLTSSEAREVSDIAADIGMERDLVLSPFVRSPEALDALRRLERRIAIEIDREGIAV